MALLPARHGSDSSDVDGTGSVRRSRPQDSPRLHRPHLALLFGAPYALDLRRTRRGRTLAGATVGPRLPARAVSEVAEPRPQRDGLRPLSGTVHAAFCGAANP